MKLLNDNQLRKLSYSERCSYFKELKDFKFSDVKEGTPMIFYGYSGKMIIFAYTITDDYLVHARGSTIEYLPTDVEIATEHEIDIFIEEKRKSYEQVLRYYEDLKKLI